MPSILNSDDGVVSGTSGLKSTGGNDGLLNIQTNGSNAISISAGQRSTFPTTIGVGGATPSTSGSGISFPATQSASSDANTLDDYEEGTWTPTLGGSSSDPTGVSYTDQVGRYTKIGRSVTVNCLIGWTTYTGGSTYIIIKGLPFTVSSAISSIGSTLAEQITNASGYTYFIPRATANSTIVYLMECGSVKNWATVPLSAAASSATGKYLQFTITYDV